MPCACSPITSNISVNHLATFSSSHYWLMYHCKNWNAAKSFSLKQKSAKLLMARLTAISCAGAWSNTSRKNSNLYFKLAISGAKAWPPTSLITAWLQRVDCFFVHVIMKKLRSIGISLGLAPRGQDKTVEGQQPLHPHLLVQLALNFSSEQGFW